MQRFLVTHHFRPTR